MGAILITFCNIMLQKFSDILSYRSIGAKLEVVRQNCMASSWKIFLTDLEISTDSEGMLRSLGACPSKKF